MPATALLHEPVGRLGDQQIVVARDGRFLRAVYRLSRVPRGRYRFTGARAVVEDPFGLAQRVQPFADASPLLVYPRLARLNLLFGERGLRAHGAGRILLRRSAGFELHSVREYQSGESLRRVHWPSTARRQPADGQGARGRAARRDRGRARRRGRPRRRPAGRLELRRPGARRRVAHVGACPAGASRASRGDDGRRRRRDLGPELRAGLAACARDPRRRRAERATARGDDPFRPSRRGHARARPRRRHGGAPARARRDADRACRGQAAGLGRVRRGSRASPVAAGRRWAPMLQSSASKPPGSQSPCSAGATIWRQCSAAPRAWWRMGRSALLALLPALLITTGWQTLEEPVRGGEFALAAALAVVAAILPRRSLRIGAMLVSTLAVASFAFDVSPLEARPFDGDHDFLGPVLSGFGGGLADFYEVSLPFNPAERPLMHGVIVLAVFAFTLFATLAIRARRPVLAAAATFAGAAWPVTLVPQGSSTMRGVLILAAALLLLAALRPGARPGSSQALLVGAAVVFAALVAVSSPSVAKGGFLDWQEWEPYKREVKVVSVQYIWDSDYNGIEFPKTATTVFTVEADAARALLAGDHARRVPRRQLAGGRAVPRARERRGPRFADQRSAASPARPRRREVAPAGSHDRGSPGFASRGRERPRGIRGAAGWGLRVGNRLRRPPGARPALLGLELRRPADSCSARALAARVPRGDPVRQPVPDRRELLQGAAVRSPGARRGARGGAGAAVRRGRRTGAVRAALPPGPRGRRAAAESLRRGGRARGVVPLERRVLATTRARRCAKARRRSSRS